MTRERMEIADQSVVVDSTENSIVDYSEVLNREENNGANNASEKELNGTEPDAPMEDSEMVENSEISEIPYEDSEIIADNSEIAIDNSEMANEDSEVVEEENSENVGIQNDDEENEGGRLSQLPISRIRKIMKIGLGSDSEVTLVNKEAAFIVGQATELFIAALAQQAAKITHSAKKKTVSIQHLISTINDSEAFSFLEGTMVPDYDF